MNRLLTTASAPGLGIAVSSAAHAQTTITGIRGVNDRTEDQADNTLGLTLIYSF